VSLAFNFRASRSCAFTYLTFANTSSAIHWEIVLYNTACKMLSLDGRPSSALSSLGGNYSNINSDMQMRAALQQQDQLHHRHMWIITGPAGCGKSSVAEYLAKELSLPYIEGDDVSFRINWSTYPCHTDEISVQYHTSTNRQKMAAGVPLTDVDRWDWLINLREAALARLSPSASSATKAHTGVVVTCSALRRRYRDVIRVAAYQDHKVAVHFVYLRANEEMLMKRVLARQGHYMKSTMVHSQMELLEEPAGDEQTMDVLEVDCAGPLPEVQRKVVAKVREVLADDL